MGEVCEEAEFATAVGACDATWADAAESAIASPAQRRSWYFIFPRCFASKKKGRVFLSPLSVNQGLLEYRGHVVGVIGFVRLAKVALAAELRRGRRIRVGNVVDVRIVGAVDEEEGGIVLAAAVSRDRTLSSRSVDGHHVLVVAG